MPVWAMACSALAHSSHLGFIGFLYIKKIKEGHIGLGGLLTLSSGLRRLLTDLLA